MPSSLIGGALSSADSAGGASSLTLGVSGGPPRQRAFDAMFEHMGLGEPVSVINTIVLKLCSALKWRGDDAEVVEQVRRTRRGKVVRRV